MTEVEKCIVALHDLGTRKGATHQTVKRALLAEGFTLETILKAIEEMYVEGDEEDVD